MADHEIVGLPSPANRGLRLLQVKIKVDYTLTSKPKAVVKFLVDRDAPMSFVTVDHKNVSTTKKKMDLDLVVRLENFARKELRGIVLLEDPDAAPGSKPLAMIGISLDVQKFQSGG